MPNAAPNGLLYECNATLLSAANRCVFAPSAINTVGASPHRINRS
eukprot:gene35409-9149_t